MNGGPAMNGVVINEALKQARFSGSATGRREAWPDFLAKDSREGANRSRGRLRSTIFILWTFSTWGA